MVRKMKIIVNYKAGQYGLAFFLQRKSNYYYVTAFFLHKPMLR